MLQGISLKKRVREKEGKKERIDMREPGFLEMVHHFIFQGSFYTLGYT